MSRYTFIIKHVHEYTEYIRDVNLRNLRNVESSVRFEKYILIEILEESEKIVSNLYEIICRILFARARNILQISKKLFAE